MHLQFAPLVSKLALSAATAVISFLAGRFWKNLLQPWIQGIWWSGTRLRSAYQGEFPYDNGEIRHDYVEVNQKASRVWGTMTVPKSKEGKYRFEAVMTSGGVLRGTFEGHDKTSSSRGCLLMVAELGGSQFSGWCIEPHEGKIVTYPYKWTARS